MFDLKQVSPILSAKFGVAVTIMVFTSACAHELFVRPSNNDSVAQEISQITPEPEVAGQASPISESTPVQQPKKVKSSKRIAKQSARKASKHTATTVARHKAKPHKAKQIVTQVASVKDVTPPPPPAPPAPEIAPPSIPAPLASAGVQTEIVDDGGNHLGSFILYGMGALAVLGLIWLAPRARRTSRPKRKLVFNG